MTGKNTEHRKKCILVLLSGSSFGIRVSVKRCNLIDKLCWFPLAIKSPPRTSKRHRTSPVVTKSALPKKVPRDTAYSLAVTHPSTYPARPGLTLDDGWRNNK